MQTKRDRARAAQRIDGGFAPNSEPQKRFLACTAFECLYGGAAGGGKTSSLVIDALRYVGVGYGQRYTGLILRRTYPELEKTVMPEARRWYTLVGGRYHENKKLWRFPAGEEIYLGHCQHEDDVLQYQGAELQYVGFDETTHFTERQWNYLISRLRTPIGIPLRIRGATNPGGPGHDWVFRRFRPWLDRSDGYDGITRNPCEWLWYLPNEQGTGDDYVPRGTERRVVLPDGIAIDIEARSRTFIGAKATDNPAVGRDYMTNLYAQDAVTRAQLLGGDWLAHAAAGLLFRRSWFHPFREGESVRAIPMPASARRIRYWDRAATVASSGKDPDWTRGVRMGVAGGHVYIDDLVSLRGTPHDVKATILATAASDGQNVTVGLEQDPGQAGVFEIAEYVRALRGYTVRVLKPTKDKITRAGPFSSQVEHGNVTLCMPASGGTKWLEALIAELECFPDGSHDDIVDACSGGYTVLCSTPTMSRSVPDWVQG